MLGVSRGFQRLPCRSCSFSSAFLSEVLALEWVCAVRYSHPWCWPSKKDVTKIKRNPLIHGDAVPVQRSFWYYCVWSFGYSLDTVSMPWRNRFSGRPETWQNKRAQLGAWGPVVSNTVDGRHPANQLRLVVYPFFPGFYTSTITLLITKHLSEPDVCDNLFWKCRLF